MHRVTTNCTVAALVFWIAAPALAESLASLRKPLDARFAQDLAGLAAKCDQLELPKEAQTTRGWVVRRDQRRQTLFLPAPSNPTRPPVGAPELVTKWHDRFVALRRAQGEALFKLAPGALADNDVVGAVQLLYEVLREDPDHPQARRILGYTQTSPGLWNRVGQGHSVRKTLAPHPLLGKPPGWKAETNHFAISTNHSEKAGDELGRELERLYDAWQQVFARHLFSAAELKSRLDSKKPATVPKDRHQVVLFKSRDDYVKNLLPLEPKIGLSKGLYVDGKQSAYFYWGDEAIRPTWRHEATHQLLHETGKVAPDAGLRQNCWLIEGIAMYMESLVFYDGYCTVGGFDAERLQDARYLNFGGSFHMPLAELTALGRDDLQTHADVRRIYSESAGLVHFLMDYQEGKYRAALADYVSAVYQGRDTKDSLAKLTGAKLADLDSEYRLSLAVTDDDLAALHPAPHVRSLLLGRTAVTDKGLAHLVGHAELESIDLSFTRTTDTGLAFLKDSVRLRELLLERTRVTETSLAAIGTLSELETLDLAGLPITDDGLAHLSGLVKLKTLDLSGTKITDAGLEHLKALKLESLETDGTGVTPEGRKRLIKPAAQTKP